MNKIKKSLISCACVLALIGVIAVNATGAGPAAATKGGADPTKPVLVVNTASEPVPVTGTIAGGTVQAAQSGAWSVGIDGTPTVVVGNESGDPLPVRDVDNPARQPFQRFLVHSIEDGEINGFDNISFTVPSGKRLVIEHVSLLAIVPTGQKLRVRLDAQAAGGQSLHQLLLVNEGSFRGVMDDMKASQQIRAYADPDTTVYIRVARNNATGVAGVNASVSGYLVDVP